MARCLEMSTYASCDRKIMSTRTTFPPSQRYPHQYTHINPSTETIKTTTTATTTTSTYYYNNTSNDTTMTEESPDTTKEEEDEDEENEFVVRIDDDDDSGDCKMYDDSFDISESCEDVEMMDMQDEEEDDMVDEDDDGEVEDERDPEFLRYLSMTPLDSDDTYDEDIMLTLYNHTKFMLTHLGGSNYESYMKETYEYLHSLETQHHAKEDPNFMNNQTGITTKMRGILIDWLIEVARAYRMNDAVIFGTVKLIDRFIGLNRKNTIMTLTNINFQLLGISSLYIMSKLHGTSDYLTKKDASYITDDSYSESDILKMEATVLKAIDYTTCSQITCYEWLIHYSNCTMIRGRTLGEKGLCVGTYKTMTMFILESLLLNPKYCFSQNDPPSKITAASMLLGRAILRQYHHSGVRKNGESSFTEVKKLWPDILVETTTFTQESLFSLACSIHEWLEQLSSVAYGSIKKYYSSMEKEDIANTPLLTHPEKQLKDL